jgi:hypothetical protein
MLDHVTIGVTDTGRTLAFYDRALRPLGITRLYGDAEGFAGYGIAPKAFFWIGIRDTRLRPDRMSPSRRRTGRPSIDFMRRPSRPAAATTGNRDYARTIIRIIMARSCSILMDTTSKPFAAHRRDKAHHAPAQQFASPREIENRYGPGAYPPQ